MSSSASGLHLPPARPLGRGGPLVSALSLGTAALGLDYGLPGQTDATRPAHAAAIKVIEVALDAGIRFFDTAPAYGTAETLLGEVTAGMADVAIITKVAVPKARDGTRLTGATLDAALAASLEESVRRLKRPGFTGVMVHSAVLDDVQDGEVLNALQGLKRAGFTGLTGASVYDEATALRVLDHDAGNLLQVAYNLLDQRMAAQVFPRALEIGAGVVVRSAFLKGALSARGRDLDGTLADLARAVDGARGALGIGWDDLAETALRFCLSAPAPVASVLIGARTVEELEVALTAAACGGLSPEIAETARTLGLTDDRLLNPARWPNNR